MYSCSLVPRDWEEWKWRGTGSPSGPRGRKEDEMGSRGGAQWGPMGGKFNFEVALT